MRGIREFRKQIDNSSCSGNCTNGCISKKNINKKASDTITWGDQNLFKLICKASNAKEGWMRSTEAMEAGDHVVVQVSTEQRTPSGEIVVTEALTTVENARICEEKDKDGKVISRWVGPSIGRYYGK